MDAECEEVKFFRLNLRKACTPRGAVTRLASDVGRHRVYIHAIIRGKNSPTLELASQISRALGTSLSAMLSDPEKNSPRGA